MREELFSYEMRKNKAKSYMLFPIGQTPVEERYEQILNGILTNVECKI